MRRKNAEEAIKAFAWMLSNRRYRAIKDICSAAKVGATIGSAFKELGYVKMMRGAYYYTGPDVLPVAEIAAKYYEIRERHKAGQKVAPKYTKFPPSCPQESTEKTYTKAQVIEAFNAFYIREFGKMTEQAYVFAGMLTSAL